jgi:two-component system, cell cycle sensor histidine kinase and response regulator CckA
MPIRRADDQRSQDPQASDSAPREFPPKDTAARDRTDAPDWANTLDRRLGPLGLALVLGGGYLTLGTAYIVFSGRIAARMAPSLEGYQSLEIAKGLLFILLNGAALFALALLWRRNLERARRDLDEQTQRARRFSHFLDALHDALPVAVLVVQPETDGSFGVRRVNPAFGRMVGAAPGDLAGRGLEHLRPRFTERAFALLLADLTRCAQEAVRLERELGSPEDDEPLWLLVLYAPLIGQDGAVERVIVTFTDTSELRRSEENLATLQDELLHSQRLMTVGELASGVAHDVNNMLTVIATHADLLERALEDRPELKRSLEVIGTAVEHASGVSRTMLDLGGKPNAQQPVLDLRDLVNEILALLERTLAKRLTLESKLDLEEPLPVRADRIQIGQVLLNLALNARDAMAGGGRLTLRLERDGERSVRLSLQDTGPGIPPELRERVFEPFFTTRADRGGTGLGLPMARRIARAHGGDLILEHPSEGGLRAVLHLPLCRTHELSLKAAVGVGRCQVLLAEHHPQVRAILANELEEAGYPARSLETTEALLELWERERPPVGVVVLARQPHGSGEGDDGELLGRLRRAGIDQPIVLMTSDEVSAEVLDRYAPLLLLRKPFGVAEFTHRVAEAARITCEPEGASVGKGLET